MGSLSTAGAVQHAWGTTGSAVIRGRVGDRTYSRPVIPASTTTRLTQYAHGGGCACKIPPGELEAVVAGLVRTGPQAPAAELVVGLDDGDDAAVVRLPGGQ